MVGSRHRVDIPAVKHRSQFHRSVYAWHGRDLMGPKRTKGGFITRSHEEAVPMENEGQPLYSFVQSNLGTRTTLILIVRDDSFLKIKLSYSTNNPSKQSEHTPYSLPEYIPNPFQKDCIQVGYVSFILFANVCP